MVGDDKMLTLVGRLTFKTVPCTMTRSAPYDFFDLRRYRNAYCY